MAASHRGMRANGWPGTGIKRSASYYYFYVAAVCTKTDQVVVSSSDAANINTQNHHSTSVYIPPRYLQLADFFSDLSHFPRENT